MDLRLLFRQSINSIRLRFHPAPAYHYAPIVYLFVLIAIGINQANMMPPIFGHQLYVLLVGIIVSVVRWFILAYSVSISIAYFSARPRTSFLGYTLATEALVIPNILLFYFKEVSVLLLLWDAWAFCVQLIGFRVISGQNSFRAVLCGYLLYIVCSLVVLGTLLGILHLFGMIDIHALMDSLQQYQQQQQN